VPDADIARGDGADIVTFIDSYARITRDSVAGAVGEPLRVRPWQRQLILQTFARREDGRRRHRIAMWGMARKNGKTAIAAPIALDGLLAQGDGAEVYSCAADRDQAKLVFGTAKRMVELDPELTDLCRLYRDAIEVPSSGSVYRALSSEAYTKEGLNPTLVIYDELHAAPNRELYDVMALAMGARIDPLMVIVTTAGVRADTTGQDGIAYRLYQHGTRVASGEVDDPSFFFAWWEPRNGGAPIGDPAAAAQANPGLGDILDPEDLRVAAMPGRMTEAEYLTKRRNQWVASNIAALPTGRFEALAAKRTISRTEPIVLFFDGSFNHDCTALVAVTSDGYIETVACWERPLDDPHWRVPIGEVDAAVREQCKTRKVVELACDPFRWAQEMQEWEAADLPVVEYATSSPARMVPAWAKFYDAVMTGRVHHDGDPRLVRHIANMALKVDRLGPRPVKEHRGSPRSIDLGICAVGGYDRATWHAAQPDKPERLGAFLV